MSLTINYIIAKMYTHLTDLHKHGVHKLREFTWCFRKNERKKWKTVLDSFIKSGNKNIFFYKYQDLIHEIFPKYLSSNKFSSTGTISKPQTSLLF